MERTVGRDKENTERLREQLRIGSYRTKKMQSEFYKGLNVEGHKWLNGKHKFVQSFQCRNKWYLFIYLRIFIQDYHSKICTILTIYIQYFCSPVGPVSKKNETED